MARRRARLLLISILKLLIPHVSSRLEPSRQVKHRHILIREERKAFRLMAVFITCSSLLSFGKLAFKSQKAVSTTAGLSNSASPRAKNRCHQFHSISLYSNRAV